MRYRLDDWECNYHDDSDFYTAYFDDDLGEVIEVMTGTTRGGMAPPPPSIPAPPEVAEVARFALAAHYLPMVTGVAASRISKPGPRDATIGTDLRLNRKVRHKGVDYAEGSVGRVFWIGANQFRTYYRNGYNRPEDRHNQRVGLELTTGERIFVPLTACALVAELPSEQALWIEALRLASTSWRSDALLYYLRRGLAA